MRHAGRVSGNLLPVPPSPDRASCSPAMGSVFGAAAQLGSAWGTMLRARVRLYGAFGAAPVSRGPAAWGGSAPISAGLDAEFHLIPILQDVISPHHLTVEGTTAPHAGCLELPVKVLVDLPGKLLNGVPFLQREG